MPAVQPRIARLLLADDVLGRIVEEADARVPDETGGILLGHCGADGDAIVMHVVGPGPRAVHLPDAFVPDYEYQEDEVARLYAESPRRLDYLGDWHTHPGGGAYLSPRDERALRTIAAYRPARVPRPVMLVLAGGGPRWEPKAWRGELRRASCWRRRLELSELQVAALGEPRSGRT